VPFRSIEDPAKLRRLLEAVLLLEADLSLPVLLRHFVEEAVAMSGARYGALGVLDEERKGLVEFITVGLSDEEEHVIGHRPTGLGVLGLLITEPQAMRMADITQHPESAGIPPGHPPMRSFLGVPVGAHDEVYGNLYLTDKIGWSEFTADDESLVSALAQAAGIAIENARLHARVQEVAVLEDRDRIARDLHDAVIQRLFAVGLSLQGAVRSAAGSPVVERVQQAIDDIDDTIRQIRSSIFELSAGPATKALRAGVLAVVGELRPAMGFEVSVVFDGPLDAAVPPEVAEHVLYSVREALTNVARHARASKASVHLGVADGMCRLTVADDGQGVAAAEGGESRGGGLGMGNLRRRAEKLGGEMAVSDGPGGGTVLEWQVPVDLV
jgi:signal transduction histidine kinase